MKRIDCTIDFVSPYAYLAFEELPRALQGLSYEVRYQPVLFTALLNAHGQRGPAEIAPKRDWIYRHALWQAEVLGIPMQMPAAHPFNPLALLRLAWACARQGSPNRYVCETVFRHVWRAEGAAADDADRLTHDEGVADLRHRSGELDVGRLQHCVGALDEGHQAARFNHSNCLMSHIQLMVDR